MKKLVAAFVFILFVLFAFSAKRAVGQDCPVCTSESECQKRIDCLSGQTQSIAAQISLNETQVALTETKINITQEKINRLTGDISSVSGKINLIEDSLAHVSTVLANRIAETYIAGRSDPVLYLLGSGNFDDFWQRLEYLRIAQKHDKTLMIQMAQTRKNYNDQKNLLQDKQKQVETLSLQLKAYQLQLNRQNTDLKILKQTTQAELDRAIAQLAGFQSFVVSQGGASLLSNQTKCDDWGCYYNQRDSQWGANSLNHTGYTLADSGCLVTSMAMVATHYGRRDVTPQTINGVSSNFAIYFPAYLNKSISAGGNLVREGISFSQIDSELSAGHPVVVGIGPGPSHFVVLVSGSGGNYLMNDPFVPGGSRIPFTSKYSLGSITEIDRVHT
ncbi:C39 family peptidase [Candidatus Microgenomates bacterium]|nr:C39 family peptidase [Candidatus Microgenomates bacterium]